MARPALVERAFPELVGGLSLSLSKRIIAFLKNLIAFNPEKKYIVCLHFLNSGILD